MQDSLTTPVSGTSTSVNSSLNPMGVCYVEVNSNSITNVGSYTLADGSQLFDIAIIFAANINYDVSDGEATLFFNPNVSNVLDNADTTIRPLQAKGIKVLLSILGNHEGAGVCNFPNQAAAQDFAQLLADAVIKYGLDGIDFDDEYADYGNNGTGQPNASSFVYLVSALRQLLPDKLITWYYIGPSVLFQSYGGVSVGSLINYAWNPYYGTYSAPDVPGLTKAALGPAAIEIAVTNAEIASEFATQTVQQGYGIYLYFNLTGINAASYLSGISQAAYGQATVYNG